MKIINDNIRPFARVGEREIHAYIDGHLDDNGRARVEAHLAQNPDLAAQVEDYLYYNNILRESYHQEMQERTVPPRFFAILNRPDKTVWPAGARHAAMVALCLLSAAGGWGAAYMHIKDNADMPTTVADRQVAVNNDSDLVTLTPEVITPEPAAPQYIQAVPQYGEESIQH